MLTRILLFIAQMACDFAAAMFLARFFMQWAQVSAHSGLGQFVLSTTDWAVRPARRILPSAGRLDLSCLVLAFLAQLAFMALAFSLTPLGVKAGPALLFVGALADTLRLMINLMMLIVLLAAIFSWINPHAPLAPLFDQLAHPLLAPFRRVIPLFGSIDLSPLVLLVLLQVAMMLVDGLRASALTMAM